MRAYDGIERGHTARAARGLPSMPVSRTPLYRHAVAMTLNSAGTAVLGVVYWMAAARSYTPSVVGYSSALISTVLLLANVSELNLANALVRFLPGAGRSARRRILLAYATAATCAVVVATCAWALLYGARFTTALVRLGPPGAVWFVAAIAVWTVFALQDSVAAGLRGAAWVPVENAFFGLAKLALLVLVAASLPRLGIFLSWTAAMAITLLPMNLLVFARLVPRHVARASWEEEPVSHRDVLPFMTLDHLGLLAATATTALLPVIVAAQAGGRAGAFFYVAWAIGTAVDVALVGVSKVLTAEGSRDRAGLDALVRGLLRRILPLAAAFALGLVVLAPWILSLYGAAYSEASTTLLRLVALTILPRVVVIVWIGVARVHRTLGRVLLLQGAAAACVVGLSTALVGRFGIAVCGVVNLVVQAALASVVLPGLLRGSGRPVAVVPHVRDAA